jgi:hypothetical protein
VEHTQLCIRTERRIEGLHHQGKTLTPTYIQHRGLVKKQTSYQGIQVYNAGIHLSRICVELNECPLNFIHVGLSVELNARQTLWRSLTRVA